MLAGVDALCLGGDEAGEPIADAARDALVAAVRSGRLAEERLAAAAGRVRALAGRFPAARLARARRLAAARRGLRSVGDVRLGPGAPVLVRLDPAPTIAVGRTAWGLDGLLPGATELVVGPDDPLPAVPADRPLVVVARDATRVGWVGRAVAGAARRPARRGRGRDGPARAGPAGARLDRHRRRLGRRAPVAAAELLLGTRRDRPARAVRAGGPGSPAAAGWRDGMIAVGVDAGGTGSRAVVVRDGVVVARRDLGPINVLLHADAVDRLAAAVTDAGAAAAGFGLAGLRSDEHARELTAELARRTGARVVVGDDTDAALAGAFAGRPGIVVIAGTGSGAAGRDAAGRTVRVGGHGFLLGDEGGGYWIGREAVRAALRAADGTGPPTALHRGGAARVRLADRRRDARCTSGPPTGSCSSRLVPGVAAAAAPARARPPTGRTATRRRRGSWPRRRRTWPSWPTAVRARLGDLPVAGVGGIFRCAPVAGRVPRPPPARAEPAEPPELGALRLLDRRDAAGAAGTVSNCGPSVRVRLSS